MAKKNIYTEPVDYFPKEIREKYFGENKDADNNKEKSKKSSKKVTNKK